MESTCTSTDEGDKPERETTDEIKVTRKNLLGQRTFVMLSFLWKTSMSACQFLYVYDLAIVSQPLLALAKTSLTLCCLYDVLNCLFSTYLDGPFPLPNKTFISINVKIKSFLLNITDNATLLAITAESLSSIYDFTLSFRCDDFVQG